MNENELILTEILKCERSYLIANKPILNAEQKSIFSSIKQRRESGEPIQYILGYCDFMGLKLNVDKRVFIPRPETEQLVDFTINICKKTIINGIIKLIMVKIILIILHIGVA